MLSNKKNILELVALLNAHGVEDVVLCPGSRNAAITHTICECGLFHTHAITDERSAGFFALGHSLATGKPTAVCVTSGSALLNLHPAVAEAYYQRVPLIVISADRPAAWIGQMDGQTMPQPHALGGMVRKSVDLPEGEDPETRWYVNRLINEALLECTHHAGGPVHINVPVSEPFYTFTEKNLPQVRTIQRLEGLNPANLRTLADLLSQSMQRMILVGQKPSTRKLQSTYLGELDRGFVSICEHLANLGPGHVAMTNPDGLIAAIPVGEEAAYSPELVITLGGHLVSKPLKQFLRKYPPSQHWHVCPQGEIVDTFGCLTTVIEATPAEFLERLAYLMIGQETEPYTLAWKDIQRTVEISPRSPEEEVVEKLIEALNRKQEMALEVGWNPVLHLANSSAVRLAQRFPLDPRIAVCCNRGINGIEGCMSAAVGFASAQPEKPHYLIIGDLSFHYDLNALWKRELPQNLHILLLNSRGGKIFDSLPIPKGACSEEYICGNQEYEAESICKHYGMAYLKANTVDEWTTILPQFVDATENLLVEITL